MKDKARTLARIFLLLNEILVKPNIRVWKEHCSSAKSSGYQFSVKFVLKKLLDNIFLSVEVTELRLMYKLTQKEIHFNMKSECLW